MSHNLFIKYVKLYIQCRWKTFETANELNFEDANVEL